MKHLKYPLIALNVIVILALFIAYISSFISPEVNKFIPLFGLFFPFIFLANILFAIFWIFYKWIYSLASIFALLIGFSSVQRFINFASEKVIKSTDIIRVSSYNVASGLFIKSEEKENFYEFIKNEFSQGVCFFQESSPKINEKLKLKFPLHSFVQIEGKRATIMSKYPIKKSGMLDFHDNFNVCVFADIDFNGQLIRVYSLHLQSNNITNVATDVRENGEIADKETWNRLKFMMSKYASSTIKRFHQTETLLKDIKSIKHPVIVGGDFNDIPQSYLYTKISDELQDSFTEKGFGLGTSFIGPIPALRIDYIFSNPNFKVLNYKTHKVEFSDHYPITSELLMPD